MTTINEVFSILRTAGDRIRDLAADALPVIVSKDGRRRMTCPHCHETPTEWIELDWAEWRELTGQVSDPNQPNHPHVTFEESERDFFTLVHACLECRQLVNLGEIETTYN